MKTIFTGTGRAGSTLVMRLLTDLGFDTGYASPYEEHNYEWKIRGQYARKETQPRIIKNSGLCLDLLNRIDTWDWEVGHVYVIIRDYKDVANHKFYNRHPEEEGSAKQEWYNEEYITKAERYVGSLMWQLISEDISHSFLVFPRIVTDPWYFYDNCALLQEVSYETFKAGFDKIADTNKVHWGLKNE
jgi:hypothetical protein